MTATQRQTEAAANTYRRAGMSVIPIGTDKRPLLPWNPYRERHATEAEAREWWGGALAHGIALVCGRISGDREVIDFDAPGLFEDFAVRVEAESPGLLVRLPLVRTPRDGRHLHYRCETIEGNQKLAERAEPTAEQPHARTTLIETRGEGGYVLLPGSPGSCHPTGRLYERIGDVLVSAAPLITADERETLLAAARSFNEFHREVKPPAPARNAPASPDGLRPGDDFNRRATWPELLGCAGWRAVRTRGDITDWCRPGKKDGLSATTGHSKSADGTPLLYVFSSNAAPFEPGNSYSLFAAYAWLNHAGDFGEATKALSAKGYGEPARAPAAPPADHDQQPQPRPSIDVTRPLHEVGDATVQALTADREIYARAGRIVTVAEESLRLRGLIEGSAPTLPRIRETPLANLRERASRVAVFVKPGKDGPTQVHPPPAVIEAVAARGKWPTLRTIEAVVTAPVLLPDGTVLQKPGLHEATGLFLYPTCTFPRIPGRPSQADARRAVAELLEVVADVPFATAAHRSTWLAALLTPLARFAFHGPAPAFAFDANTRGSGKTLCADAISMIYTGQRAARMTHTTDDAETKKRVLSIALAGTMLVLLDNVGGVLGNPAFDAALTATAIEDRLLGKSETVNVPLFCTWLVTGNNLQIAADTARRFCHARIETPLERPEERDGFRHPDLLGWVRAERPRLLAAALTLLRAYFVADRPPQSITPWGSFEGWSGLVRSAIVWAGEPDPGDTRASIREADADAAALAALLAALALEYPRRAPFTTGRVIARVLNVDCPPGLREAVTEVCSAKGPPNPKALGYYLRRHRRRVVGGMCVDYVGAARGSIRWVVDGSDGSDIQLYQDEIHLKSGSDGSYGSDIQLYHAGAPAHAHEDVTEISLPSHPSLPDHEGSFDFADPSERAAIRDDGRDS